MVHSTPNRSATTAVRPTSNRAVTLLGMVALLATGIALSGCNTAAGAGQDVSATGAAVTRGANEVKRGL